MKISEETERRLQAVLASRSDPAAMTDLNAGTLSDQDREVYLRDDLEWADTAQEQETLLGTWDTAILRRIADGF